MSNRKLYSIGQFAQMCDVTIKQLRYLEDKGILLPETCNIENNYRYYSQNQMEVLVFIKTLRDLGVVFKDICKVLQNPNFDTSVAVLQNHLDTLDDQMKKLMLTNRQCTSLMSRIQRGQNSCIRMIPENDANIYEIKMVEIPSQVVVSTRYTTNLDASDLFLDRLIELKRACQVRGIVPFESLHAVFHDGYAKQFESEPGDLETYFPVNVYVGLDDVIKVIPGFKGLSCVHIGHYKNMRTSYEALEVWAHDHDVSLSNKSIEVYLLGPETTILPDQYLTRIVIPLDGSLI